MEYLADNDKKIGFLLTTTISTDGKIDKVYEVNNVEEYCFSLLSVCVNSYLEKCIIGYEDDTVFINTEDINSMRYNLSKDEKIKLYNSGKNSFEKYIHSYFLKARNRYLINKYGKKWLSIIRNI